MKAQQRDECWQQDESQPHCTQCEETFEFYRRPLSPQFTRLLAEVVARLLQHAEDLQQLLLVLPALRSIACGVRRGGRVFPRSARAGRQAGVSEVGGA